MTYAQKETITADYRPLQEVKLPVYDGVQEALENEREEGDTT